MQEAATGESFAGAVDRTDEALRAMWRGDPGPYAGLWSRSADVTLFGALGPIEKGSENVTRTFKWVGDKFSDGTTSSIERLAVGESGDLAYTVGLERRTARLDGGQLEERTLRVTHIYRRVEGGWRLIHRHADIPPADPRQQQLPDGRPPGRSASG